MPAAQTLTASHTLPVATTYPSRALFLSLALNLALAMTMLYSYCNSIKSTSVTWHGGHPISEQTGTCLCGGVDGYCMCTPSLAIDLVIHTSGDDVWLVRRKDTSQLATMGGFVNVGETVENAVARELREEMGIVLSSKARVLLQGLYSDPRRDNRRHTVSAVYSVRLDGRERPKASDDVKQVQRIPLAEIDSHEYFADHKTILVDYRTWWQTLSKEEKGRTYQWSLTEEDQGKDHFIALMGTESEVSRSLCWVSHVS
jgi:8-oxo-dGTP diphosphatase